MEQIALLIVSWVAWSYIISFFFEFWILNQINTNINLILLSLSRLHNFTTHHFESIHRITSVEATRILFIFYLNIFLEAIKNTCFDDFTSLTCDHHSNYNICWVKNTLNCSKIITSLKFNIFLFQKALVLSLKNIIIAFLFDCLIN